MMCVCVCVCVCVWTFFKLQGVPQYYKEEVVEEEE